MKNSLHPRAQSLPSTSPVYAQMYPSATALRLRGKLALLMGTGKPADAYFTSPRRGGTPLPTSN